MSDVLGGFGPAIAGILMVYGTNDEETIRDYWRRIAVAMFVLLAIVLAVVTYYGWGRLIRTESSTTMLAA